MDIFDDTYEAMQNSLSDAPADQLDARKACLDMHTAIKPLVDADRFPDMMCAVENLLSSVLMTACPCCRTKLAMKLIGNALTKANELTAVYEALQSADEEATKGSNEHPQHTRMQ
jgi:hypothetical protein